MTRACAQFGIANTVFALGDCFLEVVSPTRPDTAAGRYIDRHGGDAGYMLIFDLEELEPARARDAARWASGRSGRWTFPTSRAPTCTRPTWPARSSRSTTPALRELALGGPEWTGRTGTGAAGRLVGVTVAVADPAGTAARWGAVLGVPVDETERPVLFLDGSQVAFEQAREQGREGVSEIAVELPDGLPGGASEVEVGGVLVRDAAS